MTTFTRRQTISTINIKILHALLIITLFIPSQTNAIGSSATIAVTSTAVCGLRVASTKSKQNIECRNVNDTTIHTLLPRTTFSAISGGRNFFCALTPDGSIIMCFGGANFETRRVYFNKTDTLESIAVGDDHVCGVLRLSRLVKCWRVINAFKFPDPGFGFNVISSGLGFSCGILRSGSTVLCWGDNSISEYLESQFGEMRMVNIFVGSEHVCGFNSTGFVVCNGYNGSGQLDVPRNFGSEYLSLALGENYSCGLTRADQTVVCWGGVVAAPFGNTKMDLIASSKDVICGLKSYDYSVVCWGTGWGDTIKTGPERVLLDIIPGPCVPSGGCPCGEYFLSDSNCKGQGVICKPCLNKISFSVV